MLMPLLHDDLAENLGTYDFWLPKQRASSVIAYQLAP